MRMIFTTIEELKEHAGGQVNIDVDLTHLTAAYRAARDKHLERYLSDEFLDRVEERAQPGRTPAPTPIEEVLIQNLRDALALLTLYEWTFTSSVQHGPNGLVRMEGDTMKGAYKYQTNDYRNWSLSAGLSALDAALRWCDLNADKIELALWDTSEAARYHRAVLIRSHRTLRRLHNQPSDRAAYEALRPLMADLQDFVFVQLIGREQLDLLLGKITTRTAAPHEARLTELLRKALAAFAVYEGMRRNLVELRGGRIVQREAMEPQSTEKQGVPSLSTIDIVNYQNHEFGERHLSAIREYLKTNSALFPAYVAWCDHNQHDPEITYQHDPYRRNGGRIVGL